MTYIRLQISFFLLLYFCSLVSAQVKFSDAERTIIRLQDERRGIDTISRYLDSKDEKIAWRAAIALANIKDSTSVKTLLSHLTKEKRQYVIDAIAFALGVFGPNQQAYKALSKIAKENPTTELFIALGRTVPKDDVESLSEILADTKTPAICSASALIEVSLRKLIDENFAKQINLLAKNQDPEVLWRSVYAYSRTEDSSLLYRHIASIKEYLGDIGSPESRMFAATALGRIHNEEAGKILIEAARSEVEWRVRVNILLAIAKLPRFSSAIYEVLKKAVAESSNENPVGDHVARTALDVLDQMIAAGKVSSPDSVSIREWLIDYEPDRELHEDQSIRIRSQCMIPLARLGADDATINEICSYVSYHDRTAEINTWKAVGLIPDTMAFYRLLTRVFSSDQNNVFYVLQGLHSLWDIIKKDPNLLHEIEKLHYANIYRHMLIRFPSLSIDPSIVTQAMEDMKDPFIVTDSLRSEAEEYLLQYLDNFAYPQFHDHLVSILSAISWLKPKNDTFKIKLNKIYEMAASQWGDQMIVDSAEAALASLGEIHQHRYAKLIRQPIDWKTIEQLPDTMLVQTQYGFMYLKLRRYDAPLTSLNMYKLAKIFFFVNNYIHRVVPNFVIQTGDNSGTGEGGPGYSIRTEISPIRYDSAGVVGMASSGKDTEGSQWFITQCPTPHLNIRYTIWGEIVKGKENIEKYQLNDQIFSVNPYK